MRMMRPTKKVVLMRNQMSRRQHRAQPSAQEEDGDQGRDERDPHVLADEEDPELHAGVLGVIAGHQLALGFGQVEGDAPSLSQSGDQETHEDPRTEGPRTRVLAGPRRCGQIERPGHHDHAQQRQPHEDFVPEHLRGRAKTPQQGILAA